jgi:hypothetical protein
MMVSIESLNTVLRDLEPVRNISDFGRALLDRGVCMPRIPGKRISRQGAALLGGRWLRLMERAGLATDGPSGWRAIVQSGELMPDRAETR